MGALVGGDGDVADPIGLAVPGLAGEGVEEEGFGDGDPCGGVEEGGDGVVGGVVEHDLLEEGGLSVAAGAAVEGVLVVVEGVVGGLDEVAAAEDEASEVEVQRVQQPFPVVGAQQLGPCWFGFLDCVSGHVEGSVVFWSGGCEGKRRQVCGGKRKNQREMSETPLRERYGSFGKGKHCDG